MQPSFSVEGSELTGIFAKVKEMPNRKKLSEQIETSTALPAVIINLTLEYVAPPAPCV
jgi:hypothetical protein